MDARVKRGHDTEGVNGCARHARASLRRRAHHPVDHVVEAEHRRIVIDQGEIHLDVGIVADAAHETRRAASTTSERLGSYPPSLKSLGVSIAQKVPSGEVRWALTLPALLVAVMGPPAGRHVGVAPIEHVGDAHSCRRT